jgi:hypothetical protein
VHTPDGAKLLANFVHNIAGLKGDWTMAAYKDPGDRRHPRAGRRQQSDLRPVRRRRFLRCGRC